MRGESCHSRLASNDIDRWHNCRLRCCTYGPRCDCIRDTHMPHQSTSDLFNLMFEGNIVCVRFVAASMIFVCMRRIIMYSSVVKKYFISFLVSPSVHRIEQCRWRHAWQMAMHAKKTHLYSLFVTIVRCRFCCARVFCVVFRQHQYFWPCGAVAFYGTSFIRKITALLSAKIKWLPFSETRHYTTILFKRSWFWLLEIRHNGRMCVCDFQASSAQSTAWMSKMVFFVSVDRLWSGVWGNSCSYTVDCDTINLQSVQLPHEQFNYLFYGIRYVQLRLPYINVCEGLNELGLENSASAVEMKTATRHTDTNCVM